MSLTGRAHHEEPIERQGTGQTDGGAQPSFSVRIPHAALAAIAYLPATLDCLNPFHGGMDHFFGYDEEYQYTDQDQFFSDFEM